MNITRKLLLFAISACALGCNGKAPAHEHIGDNAAPETRNAPITVMTDTAGTQQENLPAGIKALLESYPDFISGFKNNELLFKDGSRMEYDDGRKKGFEDMLDNSDVEDMFCMTYDSDRATPAYLSDAGRSRCDKLFKKMYGNSAAQVSKHLVKVNWLGEKVDFTAVNGAADSLRKVAAELRRHPELKKYLKSSGTFYWRKVRGARRQSAHSYGIAFDIGVNHSDYWKWKNPKAGETTRIAYANRIPKKIVKIFERYGFIWGGAWYHFDTMHFEFRPEILCACRRKH